MPIAHSTESQDFAAQIRAHFHGNDTAIIALLESVGAKWERAGHQIKFQNVFRGETHPSAYIRIDNCQWIDHACDEFRGDIFHFLAHKYSLDVKRDFRKLCETAANDLGVSSYVIPIQSRRKAPDRTPEPKDEPPLVPVPPDAPELPRQFCETGRWVYRDRNSHNIMLVIRSEREPGKKQIVPFRWGDGRWISRQMPEPRPLFNLDHLVSQTELPVLIVEGEKCAQAAQELLPDWVVTTWSCGAKAIAKSDWSVLAGRRLYCWPDNDEPGAGVVAWLRTNLPENEIYRVGIPENAPKKWDVADAIQLDGWSAERLREHLEAAAELPKPGRVLVREQAPRHRGILDPNVFPDVQCGSRGSVRVLGTKENLQALCAGLGMRLRWNEMRRQEELWIEDRHIEQPSMMLSELKSACERNQMPRGDLKLHLESVARLDAYHPFRDWILSAEWDGEDRITPLAETLLTPAEYESARVPFLLRWLIGGAAAVLHRGFFTKNVLVLQGPQNIYKTTWFKSLFPDGCFREGLILNPESKDSVITAVTHLCCELGELEATMKRDVSALKAFISNTTDTYRRPYGELPDTYNRQTIFCGTVNSERFLKDDTGSCRFPAIKVNEIRQDDADNIDKQQLWAQAVSLYRAGAQWWLSPEESQLRRDEDFQETDQILEHLAGGFLWDSDRTKWNLWLTSTAALVACGLRNPTRGEVNRAGQRLRANFQCRSKIKDGVTLYLVPPARNTY